MKKIYYGIFILTIFSACCGEVGPVIDLGQNAPLLDTNYVVTTVEAPGNKNVLIEEFTGVKCINCANGHIRAHELDSIYASRVFSVSLHSSFLDNPYDGSPNLQPIFDGVNKADQISSSYASAAAVAKPAALVDRHNFPALSTTPELSDISTWQTAVDERLTLSSPVNISITSTWNADSSSTRIRVTLHYTASVSTTHKLSIYLIEDDIVAEQLLPAGTTDTNYVHENVMRDMITAISGESLSATLEPGRVFVKEFEYKIPANWVPDNMQVIAFVHESGTANDIVQVAETHLK